MSAYVPLPEGVLIGSAVTPVKAPQATELLKSSEYLKLRSVLVWSVCHGRSGKAENDPLLRSATGYLYRSFGSLCSWGLAVVAFIEYVGAMLG